MLKIGPAAAADQQAIAGERHAAIVERVGEAAVGVAGRRPHRQMVRAEGDRVARREHAVGALGAARPRQRRPAVEAAAQQPRAGDVVGVDVGLQGPEQPQAQLLHERRVAPHLLEDGIDQHRLARFGVAEEIGVGRGLRIEQLPEDQHG